MGTCCGYVQTRTDLDHDFYKIENVKLNKDINILDFKDKKKVNDVLETLTHGFAGKNSEPYANMDWCVGNCCDTETQKRGELYTPAVFNEDRFKLWKTLLGINLTQCKRKGHVIYSAENDDVTAVIAFQNPIQIVPNQELNTKCEMISIANEVNLDLFQLGSSKFANLRGRILQLGGNDDIRSKTMKDEPHILAHLISTHPDHQGKGQGKKIMTQLVDIADKWGVSIFLDTGGEKNLNFYKKFGFEECIDRVVFKQNDEKFDQCGGAIYMVRWNKINIG